MKKLCGFPPGSKNPIRQLLGAKKILDNISLTAILEALSSFFDKENVPYVIVGGVAVIVYGYARATQDIGIIVDHEVLDIRKFCRYLRKHRFLADEQDFQEAFKETSHVSIFHEQISFRLDIKGAYSNADQDTLRTAVIIKHGTLIIKLPTPETLICHKLLFGSARDLEDALAIYQRMKPKLKVEELKRIARLLDVEKNLQELEDAAEKSISEQEDWVRRHFQ